MREIVSVLKHAFTLVAGIILTLLVLPFFETSQPAVPPTAIPTPVPDVIVPVSLFEQEAILGDLYERVAPSVVSISYGARFGDDFLFTSVSSGSGFVIDTQGHIVTNAHVVQIPNDLAEFIEDDTIAIEETRVEVRMFDGLITSAELIGLDLNSDLAVIKVDVPSDRLRPIALGDSSRLRVGQTVLAIGNPFSNDWTMTSGIISALNRSIPGLEGFSIGGVIQTDTAINPGNSGGPLVNLEGQVIGVNSQINTETGANSGIGFAVPSNLASKVSASLITDGSVEYSFMGISSLPVDLDLIEAFSLPASLRGVAVRGVFQDTPADSAGLQPVNNSVDVITAIDGTPIADFDELLGYLALNTVPGDTITLTVYRDDAYLQIPLTLTSRPSLNDEAEAESTAEPSE